MLNSINRKEESNKIYVIADVPSKNPGLGFQEYAVAISDAIRGGEPPQFTIGIYGPWGSGKSSLLNAIAKNLQDGGAVTPIIFDAWRYERSEHIIVPLIYAIYERFRSRNDKPLAAVLAKALKAILSGLTFSVAKTGLEISTNKIMESWEEKGLGELDQAFEKPFSELRKISEYLNNERVVILIDDLDRCSADKVVSVLESINLIMDIPGLIFVLALDYDILVSAIKVRYPHVSGDKFIHKMVQIPFRVPALVLNRDTFLKEIVSDRISAIGFDEKLISTIFNIAHLGFDANPRQIKRLINSFLLIQKISKTRGVKINQNMMIALIGVQLRWPSFFDRFHDSVLLDDADPLKIFRDADDAYLAKYAGQFFGTQMSSEAIRPYLHFTSVVVVEKQDPALGDTQPRGRPSKLQKNRKALSEFLSQNDFLKKRSGSSIYYLPKNRGIRFKIGQLNLRHEILEGTSWKLKESYEMASEFDTIKEVIVAARK